MLNPAEIEAVASQGYELRGFELKGSGLRSDTRLFAQVTRACLGLGNIRDGGHVVVGIDDEDPAAQRPGLSDDELASWLAYDDVARKLAEYADPPLDFEIAQVELTSGVRAAVIEVSEFADVPHICARDYPGVLRKGAIYVRPRRVPETSEIPTAVDMRDLVELATEKALRSFVAVATRAGVALTPAAETDAVPTDEDRFEAERRRAWE